MPTIGAGRSGRNFEPVLVEIELRLRRELVPRELAGAVEGLLRQDHGRLRALQLRFARCNDLGSCADVDVGQLSLGNDLGGYRLFPLSQRFRVIDPHQDGTGRDVLSAYDRNLPNAAIDARGKIHPRRVNLALDEQRFRPYQIPDRQRRDCDDNASDNDRRRMHGNWFFRKCLFSKRRRLDTSLRRFLHSLIPTTVYGQRCPRTICPSEHIA
jgi:hypothetical protein